MEVLPYEMMYAIQNFFDDKMVIRMGQVNREWYKVTQQKRNKIRQRLDSFQYMNIYQQTHYIIDCLYINDIQKIKLFFELGVINPKSSKFTNLHYKIKHIGDYGNCIVDYMDIFCHAYYVDNLFDIALVCGNIDMVKLFVENGFDVNQRNSYSRTNMFDDKIGCTPLCVFVKNYNYLLNEELFYQGYVNQQNNVDYMNILTYLCEQGADPTKDSIIRPYYQIIHPINIINSNNTGKYVSSLIKDVLREYGSFEPNYYSSDEEYFDEDDDDEEYYN